MTKWIMAGMLLLSPMLLRAERTVFAADFKNGFKPLVAADSGREPETDADKALERTSAEFQELVIGVGPDGKRYGYRYRALEGLSTQEGTIAFYLTLKDWAGDDNGPFRIFFSADSDARENLYIYRFQGDNHLRFLMGQHMEWDVVKVPMDSWTANESYHVACVWKPGYMYVYIDGQLAGVLQAAERLNGRMQDFTLGWAKWDNEKGLSRVGDVRIYDYALTAEEIADRFPVRGLERKQTAVREPMVCKFVYTDIPAQQFHAMMFSTLPPSRRGSLRIDFMPRHTEVVFEKRIDPVVRDSAAGSAPVLSADAVWDSEEAIFDAACGIAELPEGNYTVTVTHLLDGAETVVAEEEYVKYDKAPWDGYTGGAERSVPAPWTPVAADDSGASCWARQFEFTGGPLFGSITALDQPLFFRAPELRVNGTALEKVETELVANDGVSARFRQSGSVAGVRFDFDIEVEFDGLVNVALQYRPEHAGITVETMELDFFPTRENSEFLYPNHFRGESRDIGRMHDKVWSKNLYEIPTFWLGGNEVGFNFVAETLAGWHVRNEAATVEVAPAEEGRRVRFPLVDTPLALEGERKLEFAFQITPTKPYRPLRRLRADKFKFSPWVWARYFDTPRGNEINREIFLTEEREFPGRESFPYMSYKGASPFSPEWNYYGKLWMHTPPGLGNYFFDFPTATRTRRNRDGYVYGCFNAPSFMDFKLWMYGDAIRQHKLLNNMYFDLGSVEGCDNAAHGCGYVDDFGRTHRTFPWRNFREFAKRVYRMLKSVHPEGAVSVHMESQRLFPVLSFCDAGVDGEDFVAQIMSKGEYGDYYGLLTPEWYQVSYNPQMYGIKILYIPQLLRVVAFSGNKLKFDPENPECSRAIRHMAGYMLVHDNDFFWSWNEYGREEDLLQQFQDALGWDEEVEFIPYWNPDSPVHIRGEKLLSSAFVRGDRALVVVVNDSAIAREVPLDVDWQRLIGRQPGTILDCYTPENTIAAGAAFPMQPWETKIFLVE